MRSTRASEVAIRFLKSFVLERFVSFPSGGLR